LGSFLFGLSIPYWGVGQLVYLWLAQLSLVSDNINHLPLGSADAHAQFANSAEFIALVALSTALLAFYLVGKLQSKNSGVA